MFYIIFTLFFELFMCKFLGLEFILLQNNDFKKYLLI
jgi:hypothetical protein